MTTPNRTSEAVEKMGHNKIMEGTLYELVSFPLETWQAIAAKYKRMENVLPKAIEKLKLYRAQHSGEYIGGTEYRNLMDELEEALSFDPLARIRSLKS